VEYHEALEYLYSFTDAERAPGMAGLGAANLDKVHRFFDLAGRPESRFRSVLVAGTKGKGSTASYVASALQAAAYRVGLYTQPHLTTFRERMQINGALLPPERLGALVEGIQPVVEQMHREAPEFGPLTTYEIVTALVLRYFAEEGVEYAVLEIGLGGRLDAVNAVRRPLLSVITSLSLDHMQVLGNTIDKIAYEKAGIIKPSTPVVSAPQPAEAMAVIATTAGTRQAPLYVVGTDIKRAPDGEGAPGACADDEYGKPRRTTQEVRLLLGPRLRAVVRRDPGGTLPLILPLLGGHQAINAATAAAACLVLAGAGAERLTPEAIAAGFQAVQWPGRLEIVRQQPLVVLDGAHNGDSAAQLATATGANFCYRKLVLVVGAMADKDLAAILRPLLPLATTVVCTQTQHPRALAATTVAEAAMRLAVESGAPAPPGIEVAPDMTAALATATALVGPDDAVLVTGSLYLVGDARTALGLGPPPDPVTGTFFYRLDKSRP
jgi:dihydrofolate synthase/folylpolyglutamate synthase